MSTHSHHGEQSAPEPGPYKAKGKPTCLVNVHVFERSDGAELRIDVSEVNGYEFVQLRIWEQSGNGEWHATHRGVSIKIREIEDVRDALLCAARFLDERKAGGKR